MANTASNKIKDLLMTGIVDFSADSFKIILMATGFVFNKDTHHVYADVVASELPTNFGYTQGTKAVTLAAVTEDDTNDRCSVTFANVSWTAAGGAIGPTPGAIIFDDTVAAPVADPIVGYIDFGSDYTQADGGTATITGIEVRLA